MPEEAAVRREAASMNILVVDDEQTIRETCVVAEQCGMKATTVAPAEEAFEVLEHSSVDILLTDLKLAASSGLDLLQRVREPGILEILRPSSGAPGG